MKPTTDRRLEIEGSYKNVTISGWGQNNQYGRYWGLKLGTSSARIIWPKMCDEIWKHFYSSSEGYWRSLCTMNELCRGDIGSPLFGFHNERATLIGVTTSFNPKCGQP